MGTKAHGHCGNFSHPACGNDKHDFEETILKSTKLVVKYKPVGLLQYLCQTLSNIPLHNYILCGFVTMNKAFQITYAIVI